jgi:hypothetical protein
MAISVCCSDCFCKGETANAFHPAPATFAFGGRPAILKARGSSQSRCRADRFLPPFTLRDSGIAGQRVRIIVSTCMRMLARVFLGSPADWENDADQHRATTARWGARSDHAL